MNRVYYAACTCSLLILAYFDHVHGYMSLSKKTTNTEPTPTIQVSAKSCVTHNDCSSIPETSCVPDPQNSSKKGCLCGDYQLPKNAICRAEIKGPEHICTSDNECVDGSACVPVNNAGTVLSSVKDNLKTCKCLEGFFADGPECNGADSAGVNAVVILLLTALCKTLY